MSSGKSKKNVQILLSTYNGERYLHQQLDSFLALDGFEQVKVLIRDDGSTDSTRDILFAYRDRYGFEVVTGPNLGINASLQQLFALCDTNCSYFAISDQDDIWLPFKIRLALSMLEQESADLPLLFASRSQIVDANLSYLGETLYPHRGVSFYNAMAQNVLPGHTQVFNRAMLELVKEYPADMVNVIDWWMYLVAAGLGKVLWTPEATVLHRQHGHNSVGYDTGFLQKTAHRLQRLKEGRGSQLSIQLLGFYNRYRSCLPELYQTELRNYFVMSRNVITRLRFIMGTRIFRQTNLETLIFKGLYLLGKYNIPEKERAGYREELEVIHGMTEGNKW